jgi:hypothetical protein
MCHRPSVEGRMPPQRQSNALDIAVSPRRGCSAAGLGVSELACAQRQSADMDEGVFLLDI